MIVIRRMKEADLAQVAQIEQTTFSEPWSEKGFAESLALNDTIYLSVIADERVVGYCGLLRSFEEADITNVAVAQAYRGQGIGRRMLEALMLEGRQQGIERFTLEVRRSNQAALHLYESLGFCSVGIRKNFYAKPTEDAVIMWTDPQR